MIMWHAMPDCVQNKLDTTEWLPTSMTKHGAKTFAEKSFGSQPYTLLKLVVASDEVRGVVVGSDPDFEYEKEVLLAPDFNAMEQGGNSGVVELQ